MPGAAGRARRLLAPARPHAAPRQGGPRCSARGCGPPQGAAPAALPAGAACRAGSPWLLSCLKQRCRGEEGSRFCSSPPLLLPEPASCLSSGCLISPAASRPPGRAQDGAGGAAFGSGTHSAVQLGPTEPEQLGADVPRARPCPAEGRFALGATGAPFSATSALIATLLGFSAGLRGAWWPGSGPRAPLAAYTWL